MVHKSIFAASVIATLFTTNLLANPVEGEWNSKCFELKDDKGEFKHAFQSNYKFSKLDENNKGTAEYNFYEFSDAECKTKKDSDRDSNIVEISYTLGEAGENEVYPINLTHKIEGREDPITIYDIVKNVKEEDGVKLYLGTQFGDEESKRPTDLAEEATLFKVVSDSSDDEEETEEEKK